MLLASGLTERIIALAIEVERQVILEIKAVAAILPAHEAQLQTYLRMSGIRIGLILDFNASRLIDGLRRFVV
jgi:GxxExxY protein